MKINRWLPVIALLVVAILTLVAYTFTHELGHALAGLAFGGQITQFNIYFFNLSAPHVSIAGTFLPWQEAVKSMAGAGLPALLWALFLLAAPRRSNETITTLKFLGSANVIGSLLPWVIIPLLELFGGGPASDDVVAFLDASGLHPLLVAVVSLALMAALLSLYLRHTGDLKSAVLSIYRAATPWSTGARRSLAALAAVLAGGLLLAWAAGALNPQSVMGAPSAKPPEGYQLAAEIDLAERDYQNETIAALALDQSAEGGVYMYLRNVQTENFDLSLFGPDGFQQVIMRAKSYSSSSDSSLYQNILPAGTYPLKLSFENSAGRMWIYTLGPAAD